MCICVSATFCRRVFLKKIICHFIFFSLYLSHLNVAYVTPVIVSDGSNGKERQTLIYKAPQMVNVSVIKPLAIKCC